MRHGIEPDRGMDRYAVRLGGRVGDGLVARYPDLKLKRASGAARRLLVKRAKHRVPVLASPRPDRPARESRITS